MAEGVDHLSDDAATLKAALIETRAKLSGAEALIEHLQLVIECSSRGPKIVGGGRRLASSTLEG